MEEEFDSRPLGLGWLEEVRDLYLRSTDIEDGPATAQGCGEF
jgi:hypothetical protein